MGITSTGTSNNSVECLHNVFAQIQNLCAEEGITDKHQQIRVLHWLRKLRSQPTSNPTWLKSVLEYANFLLHMLLEGVIEEPFTKMPPQGPLAALPRYQRPVRAEVVVEKVSKQIQTQEQDDQWEWQRVWKGAFDKMRQQLEMKTEETKALATENKMRQQLEMKTEETEALATENKELRALVAGFKKSLDETERNQRDIEARHLAEIENLRAVQSLELSDLQSRHRQKIKEVTLQNDEKLFSRRRENQFVRTPQIANADGNSDFLQYIDDFYSATLHLTAQNKV
ncbi:WEE/WEE1 protein kinase [Phytophthora megakarya]|uniref:WEE/WEE1 protein kinase n=1 Tax=Phytophthora megakarya TaxID=4795 RepID=A0A225WN82_9STRA|nr:WEE/WEE1 protein kinase [Phytophthora megakarya]